MIIHNCEQGGEEWIRLRLSIPTASCFDQIITPKTMKLSASSPTYMHVLLAQWITGEPLDTFEGDWTRHGHEYEDESRSSYAFASGQSIEQVCLITTNDGMVGASPDGMVGDDGLVELKCTKGNTHVAYLLKRDVDEKYRTQLQGQLWVCEREWVDIQSYCVGFPSVVIRVNRDDDYISKLSDAVLSFVDVMLETREKLTQQYGPFKRAETIQQTTEFDVTDEDVDALIRQGAIILGTDT